MTLLACTGIFGNFVLDYYVALWLIYVNTTCSISGLDRFEARKKLWAELEETGLAEKKEPHTLRVPRSQRGGEVRFFPFQVDICLSYVLIYLYSLFLCLLFILIFKCLHHLRVLHFFKSGDRATC